MRRACGGFRLDLASARRGGRRRRALGAIAARGGLRSWGSGFRGFPTNAAERRRLRCGTPEVARCLCGFPRVVNPASQNRHPRLTCSRAGEHPDHSVRICASRVRRAKMGAVMGIVSEPKGIADVSPGRLDAAILRRISPIFIPRSAGRGARRSRSLLLLLRRPCQLACPTSIEFRCHREIATDNPLGAARTILESNIMGGMCARVCLPRHCARRPACARRRGKPVRIGCCSATPSTRRWRGQQPFTRGAARQARRDRRSRAGGLACAHALAVAGHAPTIFERRGKPAGLNDTASPPTRRLTISPRRNRVHPLDRRH